MTRAPEAETSRRYLATLTIAALGVVFGDIGTSPLYAVREAFHGPHALPVTETNVYGIMSLMVWALLLVISGKYLLFVMRCDNRGEGGTLALMALAQPHATLTSRGKGRWLILLGLFGASLLYGDGIITPAITVLGAIEGLEVATPVFSPYVLPLTIVILCGVFILQRRGTARIGAIFGPIIIVWFLTLATLGVYGILSHPTILAAANPWYAVRFMQENGLEGALMLGVVVLVITGGEALYADMGHFGRKPIRIAWYGLVLPSLLLNYFGQGALILETPSAVVNPFYHLAPSWALYPLVFLATLAAIIASQALISGAYSVTRQAVSLGYLPRMTVNHTSKDEIGQIYVPLVNWSMLFACVWLVLFFRTSSAMAAAYGIAVTTTMVITTILAFFVARDVWRWRLVSVICLIVPIILIDLSFFAASFAKIAHGGWFPLLVAASILTLMTTWRRGRIILADRLKTRAVSITDFLQQIRKRPPLRVPGTAIFMTSTLDIAPPALMHNVKHNKILHETILLMTVVTREVPHVLRGERFKLTRVDEDFYTLQVYYGFMDAPNVPAVLMRCEAPDLELSLTEITYFLGRETVLATNRPGMAVWRENLFSFMARNAQRATAYFRIPPAQVVELGLQVEF